MDGGGRRRARAGFRLADGGRRGEARRAAGAGLLSGRPAAGERRRARARRLSALRRPASDRPTVELADYPTVGDRLVLGVVHRALANYLAGSAADLRAVLAPGAAVSMPPLGLRARSFDEGAWARGKRGRLALATVEGRGTGGTSYTLTYALGLRFERGRPYVTSIGVAPDGRGPIQREGGS